MELETRGDRIDKLGRSWLVFKDDGVYYAQDTKLGWLTCGKTWVEMWEEAEDLVPLMEETEREQDNEGQAGEVR